MAMTLFEYFMDGCSLDFAALILFCPASFVDICITYQPYQAPVTTPLFNLRKDLVLASG